MGLIKNNFRQKRTLMVFLVPIKINFQFYCRNKILAWRKRVFLFGTSGISMKVFFSNSKISFE